MSTAIENGELRLLNLRTRIPFRYGAATMTHMPQAYVQLRIKADGKTNSGVASDLLPPKWFVKDPAQSPQVEIRDMLASIQSALASAKGIEGPTPFAVWMELYRRQSQWAKDHRIPALLAQFGISLVERALLDAFCRNRMAPLHKLLNKNFLGIQLGRIHPELEGEVPSEFLRSDPLPAITCRHTIGLADTLDDSSIPPGQRLRDGLPESLEAAIHAYGLTHFKIKVSGKPEEDFPRLESIARILKANCKSHFSFSLDGNEQFADAAQFKSYWEKLTARPAFSELLAHLLFVEQPIHRNQALDPAVGEVFLAWPTRPSLIIDESDAEFDSLRKAIGLGYDGTSHKNCKGVFKGIANRCWLRHRQRQSGPRPPVMSGEDLCNIGPVSLQQDLAIMAVLGIESVERNGHHYAAGLSLLPRTMQQAALEHHPDLYRPALGRWPTLRIERGQIRLDSVNKAPFGLLFAPELREFTPAAEFKLPT